MFTKTILNWTLSKLLLLMFIRLAFSSRRPVYIIGNQINSIEEVKKFLDAGANVLASDVQFHANGTIKHLHHGCTGDCDRSCDQEVSVVDYLQHLSGITDPVGEDSYYDRLIMQIFQLKLEKSKDKERSGREMAGVLLDHLWNDDARRRHVKVLLDTDIVEDSDAIRGFMQEFKDRYQQHRLKDVGFDGGKGQNITAAHVIFKEFKIANVWMGDVITNCHNQDHTTDRLEMEIANRESPKGFIKKVYVWTVDSQQKMKDSLILGVDGIKTNSPKRLIKVLGQNGFIHKFRIATPEDNPFKRFEPRSYK